jgi:DNA-binding IscR family transcriptional regulator
VIRTIDGPIFLTACFTEHGYCCHTDKCIVRDPLQKVHEGILRLLGNISIGDMSVDSKDQDSTKSSARLYGLDATPPVV